jgi:hypothetical protein
VEDEDNTRSVKKKKKPKKKKKHTSDSQKPLSPVVEKPPTLVATPKAIEMPSSKTPSVTSQAPTHTSVKKPVQSGPKSPVTPSRNTTDVPPYMSTSSLSIPHEHTTAQSARSYLHSVNLDSQKTKIKSRPDHASLFSVPEKKKGFFSKFVPGSEKRKDEKQKKGGWFTKLGKKSKGYMHQLLNTSEDGRKGLAPMKWENFLKVCASTY